MQDQSGERILLYTFYTDGDAVSAQELNNYVSTTVADVVSRIRGVSTVRVSGEKEYAMRIWLDPIRAAGLNISSADIAAAVRSQNVQAAAGGVGGHMSNQYMEFKLSVQGRLRTAEEFGNIVVRSENDRIVRLKDIAVVELGSKSYSGMATLMGKEAVWMSVYQTTDANLLATAGLVKAEVERLSARFPQGIGYAITYDPPEYVIISIKEIVSTLIIALLLVVFITYVFLQDWRATLIPAIAIPVSLLATLPVLLTLGYSINIFTMFGLILVIGSLVDDAIVVVENTLTLMERENLSAKEAALKSMRQITGAVIATTLVTLACYAPLAFLGGMVGTIYMQFSVAMCISLCFSTVVALTLSPALCALLLRKPSAKTPAVFKPFNAALNGSKRVYLAGVGVLVRRASLTLVVLVACLAGTYVLYGRLPSSFIPSEDKGAIVCDISLPAGATIERTEAAIRQISERIADIPGIDVYTTLSGRGLLNGNGENNASIIIKLKHWSERTTPELQIDAIIAEVRRRTREVGAARVICFTPPAILGLGTTGGVSFSLSGEGDVDPVELSELAQRVEAELNAMPETLNAMTAYSANTPQLRLELDREKAEMLRVPVSRVFTALQSRLSGFYINDFNLMGDAFDVMLESRGDHRSAIRDILDIQIASDAGASVPLSSLGSVSMVVGARQINRFNKFTSASFSAQANPGVASGDLMRKIEHIDIPRNYHVEWSGISFQERENQGRIVYLMAIAMVFAYLFLVGQYESWSIPVPVMLSVVFAVLSALAGLWLTGLSISIYVQLGLVMLIGLSAKNAILVVEFSKQERERGLSIREAAMNGASLRFRAVAMTAWSFLFGVFPLVIASGAGANSRQAIGITTFSGMLGATLVGLFFVPALYAVVQRLRERVKAGIVEASSGRLKIS